ncbi:hypothetical protein [Sulfitobacter sp. JB4-11]|uniref:hypothetical protein n=1 Tax=Sulfitobacter rhodophyticola TaxID=3238304 RepID=UPI003D812D71
MTFRRMFAIALAATVGLLFLAVLGGLAMGLMGLLLQAIPGLSWMSNWMVLPLICVVWSWLPSRFKSWPCTYEIRGSAIIDAPPNEVWRWVFPQPGTPYFLKDVQDIKAVDSRRDRVDLVFDGEAAGQTLPPLEVQLEEVDPQNYLRMSYLNGDAYPLWTADLVKSEYWLEREGEKTRLTLIETLDRLRVSTVLALLFLNPCKDAMKIVQACCTGQPDTSRMARMQVQFDHDTPEGAQTARTINGVAIMICILMTLIGFGVVTLLVSP